ncbi:MAG: glycosyltransferase [Vulcanimicrobiaceae bacterium]|jgi:glycosyltransferase involved in cell wall biosynthesis
MTKPLLVLEGEVYSELSLARANRELALALLRRDDVELALSAPLLGSYLTRPTPAIERLVARTGIALERPPDLTVHHMWPPNFQRPAYGRYAHVQPYELGALPTAWRDSLRGAADEIWCYGSFVRDMYLRAGFAQDQLVTVPLGIDPAVFRPDGDHAQLAVRGQFRFLYVGGTIWRKGADIAVNAFLNAFGPTDDVCLIVKDVGGGSVYRDQSMRALIEPVTGRTDLAEVVYSDAVLDDEALAALYRSADVVLLPYRGEGFGLTALEAMACGTPPIVTKGGATDDFVDPSVGIQLPASRKEITLAQIPDLPDTVEPPWRLEVDVQLLARVMRMVVEQRSALRPLGEAAARRAREEWTWDRGAAVMAERARLAAGARIP